MSDGLFIVGMALLYLSMLFAVAWAGDRPGRKPVSPNGRPTIYALSLAVYCTSWTFFGSVGAATAQGPGYFANYIGPILLFVCGTPLLTKVVRIAKSQNITSVADFIAARHGKSSLLAAIVTFICVFGSLPYIALQLKAVSLAVEALIGSGINPSYNLAGFRLGEPAFVVAVAMIVFASLFGTRHIDVTEHQPGLVLAVAMESVVKLFCFLLVGGFVIISMLDVGRFWSIIETQPEFIRRFVVPTDFSRWCAIVTISFCCALLLPRQFHVTVVENNSEAEIKRAKWAFPLYLVLINALVIPIAITGVLRLRGQAYDADMLVLLLPLKAKAVWFATAAFVGGLSAATAMVIVESVALSIMVSNDLVLPLLVKRISAPHVRADTKSVFRGILWVRRITICLIILGGYLFYTALSLVQGLVATGLLSFAAISQLGPAFFGGMIWRGANRRGALAGITTGFLVWGYTLLLPWTIKAGWFSDTILGAGPFGLMFLRPEHLFGVELEPLTHGVFWSLACNIGAYYLGSISRSAEAIERIQANVFLDNDLPRGASLPSSQLWRVTVTVEELQKAVARYVGLERTEQAFQRFEHARHSALAPHAVADLPLLRFGEKLLASTIGAPSARLVVSMLLGRRQAGGESALKVLDNVSEAVLLNRDLLQTALNQVRQGIAVFDKDMRLVCWNNQFGSLLWLAPEIVNMGIPLNRILRYCAENGHFGQGDREAQVSERIHRLAVLKETYLENLHFTPRRVLEVRSTAMPKEGIVVTLANVTERIDAIEAQAVLNTELERRVSERTRELDKRTHELIETARKLSDAKAIADQANLDKTRFIGAVSHDIMQPLNAARLYTTSLIERTHASNDNKLARNIDSSLAAVEEILKTLSEISRLDRGQLIPEIVSFSLNDVFDQLALEFTPLAKAKGIQIKVVRSKIWVKSDRRMLRRILQNLVGNAIKYTPEGKVLLGARVREGHAIVQVCDTGPGIPTGEQQLIFKEFHRIENSQSGTRGLGLGLSIVDRMAKILNHTVRVDSTAGHGSIFSVVVPVGVASDAPRPMAEIRTAGGPISGINIMCIDNEPTILDSMRELLTGWGCKVVCATSPDDAVSVLRKTGFRPDIILVDYHLNNLTGRDAIDAVRTLLRFDVPACIITADHSPELHRSLRLSGLPVLRKPLKTAALRAVLSQLSLQRAAAE